MLRGFYHYAYPEYSSAQAEAAHFASVVGALQPGELMCLDFEEQYSDPVNWCSAFLSALESAYNGQIVPLVYLNYATVERCNWAPVSAHYPLWLAAWQSRQPVVSWPAGVPIWQNDDIGPAGGDADIFFGSISDFQNLGYRGTPAPVFQWKFLGESSNVDLGNLNHG
jgi:GH25 family lysozyme M1 (1,4-beta-N-acetylmuramidase)